jgi:methyl-accepting chemotaxis protein
VSTQIDRDVNCKVSEVTAQGAQEAAKLSGAVTEEANQLQTLMSKFRV